MGFTNFRWNFETSTEDQHSTDQNKTQKKIVCTMENIDMLVDWFSTYILEEIMTNTVNK